MSWKLKKRAKALLAGEQGTVFKEWGGRLTVALVYPNRYALGMSNLGYQSVYNLFNSMDDVVCERAFLPEKGDVNEFINSGTPLFTLESQRPLHEFDLIAFSIPFEEDYLNVPTILSLAGIPLLADEREVSHPLVMAGGVACFMNPEPVAPFVDCVAVGEGESFLPPFVAELREHGEKERQELLERMAEVAGVYVPGLYDVEYDGDVVRDVRSLRGAPDRIVKVAPPSLDAYRTPQSYITTAATEFGETFLLEVERGCGRGCRFCAAGFVYLPMRERDRGSIAESMIHGEESVGKVGLVGAAVSEYDGLKEIVRAATERGSKVTLSSLRMDMLDDELLGLLKAGGYETITIAPEAGSQRLRDVINKGISDAEIMASLDRVKSAGFRKVKFYFLVGLPTEGPEDIEAIIDLTGRAREILKKGEIALSVNPFIPKPWTPFQWAPYEHTETLEKKLTAITKACRAMKSVKVRTYSTRMAYLQTILSRGDRRVAPAIAAGAERGWKAFLKCLDNPDGYVYRTRDFDERLPWDIIDHGITKEYLWKEYERALKGQTTPPCDIGRCFRCGVCG